MGSAPRSKSGVERRISPEIATRPDRADRPENGLRQAVYIELKGKKDPAPVEGKSRGRGLKASPAAGGPPPVIYYDQMSDNRCP